jgi:hypothetical protein
MTARIAENVSTGLSMFTGGRQRTRRIVRTRRWPTAEQKRTPRSATGQSVGPGHSRRRSLIGDGGSPPKAACRSTSAVGIAKACCALDNASCTLRP